MPEKYKQNFIKEHYCALWGRLSDNNTVKIEKLESDRNTEIAWVHLYQFQPAKRAFEQCWISYTPKKLTPSAFLISDVLLSFYTLCSQYGFPELFEGPMREQLKRSSWHLNLFFVVRRRIAQLARFYSKVKHLRHEHVWKYHCRNTKHYASGWGLSGIARLGQSWNYVSDKELQRISLLLALLTCFELLFHEMLVLT